MATTPCRLGEAVAASIELDDLLAVCFVADVHCLTETLRWFNRASVVRHVTIGRRVFGRDTTPVDFAVTVISPVGFDPTASRR